MALSKVQIANMALAEVPASRISDFEGASVEAGYIRDNYQPALDLLLEAHTWDFINERIALAEIVNDRSDEWGFCYSLPSNMASPRRLYPPDGGTWAGPSVVAGLQTVAYPVYPAYRQDEDVLVYPYVIAAGKLYTDLGPAILEYARDDVSESAFTALYARALSLELAARIVVPLKQSDKRQAMLQQMAEIARERAVAENMNRQPRQDWRFTSQEAMIRGIDP